MTNVVKIHPDKPLTPEQQINAAATELAQQLTALGIDLTDPDEDDE